MVLATTAANKCTGNQKAWIDFVFRAQGNVFFEHRETTGTNAQALELGAHTAIDRRICARWDIFGHFHATDIWDIF